MKIWKLLIVIFLVLGYAYAAWMTSIDTRTIWGWVCTLIFGILSLIGIYEFSHQKPKNTEE
jgi:ABC-type Fe3+ transport system permease subunit